MLDTKVHFGVLLKLNRAVTPTVPRVLTVLIILIKGYKMFGSIIKGIAEFTGKIVGETTHQIGETLTAISEIPEAFSKGYDEELFNSKDSNEVNPDSKSEE